MLPVFSPTPEEYANHIARTTPVPRGESVSLSKAKSDPVYFVVNQLGVRPYMFQACCMDELAKGRSVMACTSRQVGKTAFIAWFSLWACVYNRLPLPATKKTRIIIISATEQQSVKIISDIKEFMRVGDEHIFSITKSVKNWFTEQIDKNGSNNTSHITFKNGCEIISLPPTDRARGYTGSIIFKDESAFIADDIHKQVLDPIVAKSGGLTCDTSTPNGNQGDFFKRFDPNDEMPEHNYARLWLPYTSMELDDPKLVERHRAKERTELLLGNERQFQQEYMASFNSAQANFFDTEDVDKCVRKDLDFPSKYEKPCDLAVDFGANKVSRTVITITCLEHEGKSDEYIRLLYQKEYAPDNDLSLWDDIIQLRANRFPGMQRLIFEDCPAAAHWTQLAMSKGYDVRLFNPSSEKAPKYFALRAWMRRGKVKFGLIDDLIRQMKGLVQEDGAKVTKIHHGNGLLDDRIDSFMMSTYFFTEERPTFRVWDIDEVP